MQEGCDVPMENIHVLGKFHSGMSPISVARNSALIS